MKDERQAKDIDDELFCLSYELGMLSSIVNRNSLERWVPGFCKSHTEAEHRARYHWAAEYCRDRHVLDCACGCGGGSLVLADEGAASSVTACDIDEATVKYALIRHPHPHINYERQDAEQLRLSRQFDCVVSFETIEHLQRPERFLSGIKEYLKPQGTLLISTPISVQEPHHAPNNIFHKCEWGFSEFHDIVSAHFKIEGVFLQGAIVHQRSRIISAGLRVFGHNSPAASPIDYAPFPWNRRLLSPRIIEKRWGGFQILKCALLS